MIPRETLNPELYNDPANVGYAAALHVADDAKVAALLNAPDPAGGMVKLAKQPKNTFLELTVTAAVRLKVGIGTDNATQLSASVIGKWTAGLDQARAADPGSPINLAIMQTLGNPVIDLVMTRDEFNALTARPGSRAEVITSVAGTVATAADVANARN